MKITIKELKESIFDVCIPTILESLVIEDSELEVRHKVWTGKDIHDKVERLLDKATKLRKISARETKPIKHKLYARLSDQMMKMAEELTNAYEITKDPNVIYDVYKEFGFDPLKV